MESISTEIEGRLNRLIVENYFEVFDGLRVLLKIADKAPCVTYKTESDEKVFKTLVNLDRKKLVIGFRKTIPVIRHKLLSLKPEENVIKLIQLIGFTKECDTSYEFGGNLDDLRIGVEVINKYIRKFKHDLA